MAIKRTNDFTIGVDLGGTKMLTALVDSRGHVIHQATLPVTPPEWPMLDPRDPYRPTALDVKKRVRFQNDATAAARARKNCFSIALKH